jgi:cell division protein FtsI/penicillin-binding protein 2
MMNKIFALLFVLSLSVTNLVASRAEPPKKKSTVSTARPAASGSRAPSKVSPRRTTTAVKGKAVAARPKVRPRRARRVSYSPWKEPTYADSTEGDFVDGEDIVVRRAAVEALGRFNGTVVVSEAATGRVLAMVNQKLAYKSGFQPCSTIKVVVGMAALTEGVIERTTPVRLTRRTSMDLTHALAKSDNPYFALLGQKLGFDRVSYYARLFGLGERATLDSPTEQPGRFPSEPPEHGGVGMLSSFGEGIQLTPLQLAAMLGAIANGGTLYYLQHPQSPEEVENFIPRVKRNLDIQTWIPEIRPGMMGAVEFGTARRAGFDPENPIYGKTGTCTDRLSPTHLGWFGSFNETGNNKLVVVVLLTGGRPVNGPVAAGIAGNVYKALTEQQYFAKDRKTSPVALIGTQCCGQ